MVKRVTQRIGRSIERTAISRGLKAADALFDPVGEVWSRADKTDRELDPADTDLAGAIVAG